MRRHLLWLLGLLLVVGACSSDSAPAPPVLEAAPLVIVANGPGTLAVGDERLLIGLIAADTANLAFPERAIEIDLVYDGEVVSTVPGEFLWTVPELRGLYRAQVTFDRTGTWAVIVRSDDLEVSIPTQFTVAASSSVPDRGEAAPLSVTPTSAEYDLADITTDPDPDPRFYELSLDDALTNGTPTVAVFATPAFCQTAACGPTLDVVKQVSTHHPDVDFVHVEVYTNLDAGSFEGLELVPAIDDWRLPSEPWIFVVDGSGIIAAAFEGALAAEELEAALAGL